MTKVIDFVSGDYPLRAGGKRHQLREIKASGGYRSFDAPQAHFGLGANATIQKVEIRWSDGTKALIKHPFPANREYVVKRVR